MKGSCCNEKVERAWKRPWCPASDCCACMWRGTAGICGWERNRRPKCRNTRDKNGRWGNICQRPFEWDKIRCGSRSWKSRRRKQRHKRAGQWHSGCRNSRSEKDRCSYAGEWWIKKWNNRSESHECKDKRYGE